MASTSLGQEKRGVEASPDIILSRCQDDLPLPRATLRIQGLLPGLRCDWVNYAEPCPQRDSSTASPILPWPGWNLSGACRLVNGTHTIIHIPPSSIPQTTTQDGPVHQDPKHRHASSGAAGASRVLGHRVPVESCRVPTLGLQVRRCCVRDPAVLPGPAHGRQTHQQLPSQECVSASPSSPR